MSGANRRLGEVIMAGVALVFGSCYLISSLFKVCMALANISYLQTTSLFSDLTIGLAAITIGWHVLGDGEKK